MAERTRDQFIYYEKGKANYTTEIDIERVNIRPRKYIFFSFYINELKINKKKKKYLVYTKIKIYSKLDESKRIFLFSILLHLY